MFPTEIRVYPLSKIKEKEDFGTIEKAEEYFCEKLPTRNPSGRFNIPSDHIEFKKDSLVLFQYAEKKDEEKIIAHASLISDGCIYRKDFDYIGYYLFDINSINYYKNPVTRKQIFHVWHKKLCQAKLNLDVSKFNDYINLLKRRNNLKSKCS